MQGPEVRSGDLAEPLDLEKGQRLTFTIQEGATGEVDWQKGGARGLRRGLGVRAGPQLPREAVGEGAQAVQSVAEGVPCLGTTTGLQGYSRCMAALWRWSSGTSPEHHLPIDFNTTTT
jgi:hypothetical protein